MKNIPKVKNVLFPKEEYYKILENLKTVTESLKYEIPSGPVLHS